MTATVETLSQFSLAETDDGFLLEIAGDGGSTLTLAASPEQIDAIVEALDALLSDEDDALDDPQDEDDVEDIEDDEFHDDDAAA